MCKIKHLFFFLFFFLFSFCNEDDFVLSSENISSYKPLLENKNIALVVNQTSLINKTHLVDTLISLHLNLVKIFSPEHGFRGELDAGKAINDTIDLNSGLPIISLYGKNKKPTMEHLKDIDVILFDIQDVGARFYTYISTLHYVMESASENNIPLIILDRPNPNGHYCDGPVLDLKYKSFVGMHPVPVVHGMTIGEYAQMINGEKWISKKCDLTVIPMINYNRKMFYSLPIKPSPNLPNSKSINLYPSLCFFEGTNISVGRGTNYPFQHFGAPYLDYEYSFTPISGPGSKYPKYENQICFGIDLKNEKEYFSGINLEWLIKSYNECPDKNSFFNNFFDKLAGNDKLRKQIISNMSIEDIKLSWQDDLLEFKEKRKKYLIY